MNPLIASNPLSRMGEGGGEGDRNIFFDLPTYRVSTP